MNITPASWLRAPLAAALLLIAAAPLHAQAPSATAPTAVMVNLTVKADVDRAQITRVMPDEVRATLRLYLDGKIQQWYSRGDGRGVMFILNCTTVGEAKAITDGLPLSKANLATFEFMALSPLAPLRMLLADPAASPKGQPQP
ncbi:MAG TPA: hypothetical protein VGY48_20435 [Vicinamibacterales bacterium]|jgi:hypothetical protein|nr:hypothetical protein [Vicinamibacterales bacterium]